MTTSSAQIVNWFEIPVTSIPKAAGFYEAMLHTAIKQEIFNGIPHGILTNADHSCVSGALIVDPKRPPAKGGSAIYFRATDGVKRCLARAVDAGAHVVQPWTSIGPMGAYALLEDLDGNLVGLHEEAQS